MKIPPFFAILIICSRSFQAEYPNVHALKYRIEGDRVYDREWSLKGYIQDGKIYDRNWNRKGHIGKGK